MQQLKIGLFGIGLSAYWPQFDGLKPRLEGYLSEVEQMLNGLHPGVLNAGIVDDVDKAFAAGQLFRSSGVDLIFLHVTTYALSAIALPVVQQARVPVVILDLAPEAAMDYARINTLNDRTRMTGEWLAFCSACPVPELSNVFTRVGVDFHQVSGVLRNDPIVLREVREWVEAAGGGTPDALQPPGLHG
jgi:L-arabinose isomerase